MVTVRLKAGMGNQMFQYAFGLRMARLLDTDLSLDLSLLLDRARGTDHVYRDYDLTIFKLQAKFSIAPHLLRTLYKTKSAKVCKTTRAWIARNKLYIREPHFSVSKEILENPKNNSLYEGWWQSERYFSEIEEEIRQEFAFKTPIIPTSEILLSKIKNSEAICLNVRRTDFLKTASLNTTNRAYFLKAAEQMAQKIQNPHFFIFSDDVKWCAEHLNLPFKSTLVTHTHKGEKFGNYMQLMTACQHFIIPNSSFAWWAVWLNKNLNKQVIAPKNWFAEGDYDTSDLVPNHWERL